MVGIRCSAKREVNATFERSYLMKVLERARGWVSEAVRLAGIDRTAACLCAAARRGVHTLVDRAIAHARPVAR